MTKLLNNEQSIWTLQMSSVVLKLYRLLHLTWINNHCLTTKLLAHYTTFENTAEDKKVKNNLFTNFLIAYRLHSI